MPRATLHVERVTFLRAEHSYGSDDPFRYECRINGDDLEIDRTDDVDSPTSGFGRTPADALNAAITDLLDRRQTRLNLQSKLDAEDV